MLSWIIASLFVVALIAAIFGFWNVATVAADIALVLFLVFAVLFVATALVAILRRRFIGPGRNQDR